MALVIALHGAGDSGPGFERTSGLSLTADQAGFAVVYPDALFNPKLGASDWQHYGDDFAILHGDTDAYCGTPTDASQDQTFDYWTGGLGNNCLSIIPAAPLCDATNAPSGVFDKSGETCSGGAAVKLYRLIGGRHEWYGSLLNTVGTPPFNPDLNAATGTTVNEIVWKFSCFLCAPCVLCGDRRQA